MEAESENGLILSNAVGETQDSCLKHKKKKKKKKKDKDKKDKSFHSSELASLTEYVLEDPHQSLCIKSEILEEDNLDNNSDYDDFLKFWESPPTKGKKKEKKYASSKKHTRTEGKIISEIKKEPLDGLSVMGSANVPSNEDSDLLNDKDLGESHSNKKRKKAKNKKQTLKDARSKRPEEGNICTKEGKISIKEGKISCKVETIESKPGNDISEERRICSEKGKINSKLKNEPPCEFNITAVSNDGCGLLTDIKASISEDIDFFADISYCPSSKIVKKEKPKKRKLSQDCSSSDENCAGRTVDGQTTVNCEGIDERLEKKLKKELNCDPETAVSSESAQIEFSDVFVSNDNDIKSSEMVNNNAEMLKKKSKKKLKEKDRCDDETSFSSEYTRTGFSDVFIPDDHEMTKEKKSKKKLKEKDRCDQETTVSSESTRTECLDVFISDDFDMLKKKSKKKSKKKDKFDHETTDLNEAARTEISNTNNKRRLKKKSRKKLKEKDNNNHGTTDFTESARTDFTDTLESDDCDIKSDIVNNNGENLKEKSHETTNLPESTGTEVSVTAISVTDNVKIEGGIASETDPEQSSSADSSGEGENDVEELRKLTLSELIHANSKASFEESVIQKKNFKDFLSEGKFTPEEDEQIRKNWKRYFKAYPHPDEDLFIKTEVLRDDYQKKLDIREIIKWTGFWQHLGRKVLRTTYSVKRRCSLLVSHTRTERYTLEEDEKILSLYKMYQKERNRWTLISEHMDSGRNTRSIQERYKKITAKAKGPWSSAEEEQLKNALKTVNHGVLPNINDQIRSWVEVARHVKTRTAEQCLEKWKSTMSKPEINYEPEEKIKSGKYRIQAADQIYIIQTISSQKVNHEKDIDWNVLVNGFKGKLTRRAIQQQWKCLKLYQVKNFKKKNISEIVEDLKKEIPVLEKRAEGQLSLGNYSIAVNEHESDNENIERAKRAYIKSGREKRINLEKPPKSKEFISSSEDDSSDEDDI